MVSLPAILTDKKYENTWEWDGWKPKAKPNAPQVVKDAIAEWLADVDNDDEGDDNTLIFT